MAVSLKTSGTWTAVTADATPALVGSPAAGDRYFLWVAWKDYSVTCSVANWTEVIEYADGAVAQGSGTGSMKVACYYRDWQSGDGNPTIDFSASPNIAAHVMQLWQKGGGDTWATPWALSAALASATSLTGTSSSTHAAIPDGSVIFGFTAKPAVSAAFTRTSGTAISGTQLTYGSYVESPSSHLTTTTNNDMSCDLGHKIVTTGCGVNAGTLGMTATVSAATTAAHIWVVQGLVPAAYSPTYSVKGTAVAAAASIALPAHVPGDLILLWSGRNNNTAVPVIPTAAGSVPPWVSIDANVGDNSCSLRLCGFVAVSSGHTSGTWASANKIGAAVISGASASYLGGHAEAGTSASATVTVPAITLTDSDGSSIVLGCAYHKNATAFNTPPVGYTTLAAAASSPLIAAKVATLSDGSWVATSTDGTAVGGRATQVEILMDGVAPVVVRPTGATLSLTGGTPTIVIEDPNAPKFDVATTYLSTGSGTGATWSHTTGAGTHRYGIVIVAPGDEDYTWANRAATWGGQPMTSLGVRNSNDGTAGYVEMFGIADPPVGASDIVFSSDSTSGERACISLTYTNIGSVGTAVTSAGAGAGTISISSSAGSIVVAGFCYGVSITGWTQTHRAHIDNGTGGASGRALAEDAAGGGTTVLGFADGGDWYGGVAVELFDTGVRVVDSTISASQTWTNNATFPVTCPTGVIDDDLLIVLDYVQGVFSEITAPDGSWALADSLDMGGTDNLHMKVWTKAAASEPSSWNFGKDNSDCGAAAICIALRNADPTIVVEFASGASGSTIAAPTIAAVGDLLIAACGLHAEGSGGTITLPGDLAQIENASADYELMAAGVIHSPPNPTGAKTFTVSPTTRDRIAASVLVTVPAAGGGNVTVTPTGATLSLTGGTPVILRPVVSAPPGATLTLTGGVPVILRPVVSAPPGATLVLTGGTPVILRPVVSAPPGATLALTGGTPVILRPVVSAPPGATLALTGGVPVILRPVVSAPPGATLALTGGIPAILITRYGTSSGAYTFAGTATGAKTQQGTAAGSYTWAGSATGRKADNGTATGTYTWAGSASGIHPALPVVVQPPGATLALTGGTPAILRPVVVQPPGATLALTGGTPVLIRPVVVTPPGGSLALTGGTPIMVRPIVVQPSGATLALTGGTPAILIARHGTAAGTYTWAGSAQGVRAPKGTGAGAYTWADDDDAGYTAKTGSAAGAYTWGSNAAGVSATGGTAAGVYRFDGSAAGIASKRGTASGTYTFAGTATGSRQQTGSAAGDYEFAGTANGVKHQSGSATGDYEFAGSAIGHTAKTGAAAGAYTWGSNAAGISSTGGTAAGTYQFASSAAGETDKAGTASGTYTFAGTAAGETDKAGTASGTYAWSGTAQGLTPIVGAHEGTASGTYDFAASATGYTAKTGAAAGTYHWSSNAAGISTQGGTAAGTYEFASSAQGETDKAGTAAGAYDFAASATGRTERAGSASGAYTWAGSADGSTPTLAPNEGTSSGDYGWAATAQGETDRTGTAAGAYDWSGSAIGLAPLLGVNQGTAAGTYAFDATANGVKQQRGSGTGDYEFAATANGAKQQRGSGAGIFTWVSSAQGGAVPAGMAMGAYVFAGDGAGYRSPKGSAAGEYLWAATAFGMVMVGGYTTGGYGWVAVVIGYAGRYGMAGIMALEDTSNGSIVLADR